MAVDIRQRSSIASGHGRKLVRRRGDVCVRRDAAGAERFQFRSQVENNMMGLLSRAGLRYNEKSSSRRADRSPGWCRAGGGLLRGKDPAGRFALGVVTFLI